MEIADLAKILPDGDQRLAKALGSMHTVLGFVLDPEQPGSVAGPPILVRGSFPFSSLWRGAGAIGPAPSLSNKKEGLGTLSLPADADGVTRRVPLFVGAGEDLLPGLALETVRVLRRVPDYELQSDPPNSVLVEPSCRCRWTDYCASYPGKSGSALGANHFRNRSSPRRDGQRTDRRGGGGRRGLRT